jgi:hypothetical protein
MQKGQTLCGSDQAEKNYSVFYSVFLLVQQKNVKYVKKIWKNTKKVYPTHYIFLSCAVNAVQ